MCKLCNTDREPAVNYIPRTEKAILFLSISQEYINERPCRPCIRTVENKWNRTIKSKENLDKYILKKLLRTYYGEIRKPESRTSKNVLGIYVKTNTHTGYVSYCARVANSDSVINIGTYGTLQEALQAKIDYCVVHNMSKSLIYTQKKLKELQNV